MTHKLTTADLKATFDAFNRHDIDGIMTHFADDCVFFTAAGDNDYGNKVEGKPAIAKAFQAVWGAMSDAQWANHEHFISEDGTRAVSEWTFRATNPDGTRTEAQGVDLFRIRDGQIVEKTVYRKQRPAIQAK